MKKFDKKVLIILFFVFLACSRQNDSRTTITFWAMGAEGQAVTQFIKEFEDLNPDIKVEFQTIPWRSAHDKLITAFAGRSTPDICQLGNTWVAELNAMDALASVDSFISRSTIIKKEKYFEGSWASNIINNLQFGIPWYVETRALFYRKDLLREAGFENPPRTWDELFEVAGKLSVDTNNDGKNDKFGIFLPINPNLEPIEVIFAYQNNGEILKDNNSFSNVESPEVVEALEFYIDFFRKEYSPIQQNQITNLYQAFISGYIGMFINGPWNMNELRNRYPEMSGKWAVAPLPIKKSRTSNTGGSNLVIFNSCNNKTAAWKLIEFLSSPEVQRNFYKITYDLPAVKEAWADTILFNDPNVKAFYIQLENTKPAPAIPECEQVFDKMGQWVEIAIFNKKTIRESVQGMRDDINRLLEKRRRLNAK